MEKNKLINAIRELNEIKDANNWDPKLLRHEVKKVYEKYDMAKPNVKSITLQFDGNKLKSTSVDSIIDEHVNFLKNTNKKELLEEKKRELEQEKQEDLQEDKEENKQNLDIKFSVDFTTDFIMELMQMDNPEERKQALKEEIFLQATSQGVTPEQLNLPCTILKTENLFETNTKNYLPEDMTILEATTEAVYQQLFEKSKENNKINTEHKNNDKSEPEQNENDADEQYDLSSIEIISKMVKPTVDNVIDYYLQNGNITPEQEAYLRTQDINGLEELKSMIPPSMLPPELTKFEGDIQ